MLNIKYKKLTETANLTNKNDILEIAMPSQQVIVPSALSSQSIQLKTGLEIECPKSWYAEIVLDDKLAVATKLRLIVGVFFGGELVLEVENVGHHTEIIRSGQTVARLLFKKLETLKVEEIK